MMVRGIVVLFFLFHLSAPSVEAQTGNWQQTNGPYATRTIRKLLDHPSGDIFCFGRALYIDNYLLRSSDHGQTWNDVNRRYTNPATGLSIPLSIDYLQLHADGSMYASATVQGVYRSTDKGATWEKLFDRLGTISSFRLLGITSSGHLFAEPHMPSDGYIYYSGDNGKTWERRQNGLDTRFPANVNFSTDAYGNLYLQNFIYKLYGSTDNGLNWSVLYSGSTDFMTVYSRGVLFIGSNNSTNYTFKLMRSVDQGVTWTDIYPDVYSKKIRVLNMLPGPSGQLIMYTKDSLLISTDLGDSWKPASLVLTGEGISDVCVTNAGEILVGTDIGWIYRSTDAGLSWTRRATRLQRYIWASCLASNSRNMLFAASSSDGLFVTTNQGTSWNAAPTSVTGTNVTSLAVGASDQLYLGTTSNGLFVSSDDGASWRKLNTIFQTRPVNWIGLNSKGHIYVVAMPDLFRSTNDGASWESKATTTSFRYITAAIGANDEVYASFSDDMYYSSDGGNTWTRRNTGLPTPTYVTAIAVADGGGAWLGTSSGGLYYSSNQGGSWTSKPTRLRGPSNKIKNILCLPNNQMMINVDAATGYVGIFDEDFGIFHSTNGGSSWRILRTTTEYTQETALTISKTRDGSVLAGLSHGVMMWRPSATSVRAQEPGISRPIRLEQNYPNPFNPATSFEFQVPSLEFVSLRVLDVLGREVATLVDEYRQPGVYSVRWNASGLPSGVYFCRMNAGGFVDTKRMILSK